MDILAHGLWAGLGARWLTRRRPAPRAAIAAAVGLSILPDLVHLAPVAAWSLLGAGGAQALIDYALASPGAEPAMPGSVALYAHHLHCILHSAPIAAAASALLWPWRRLAWLPLAGWWLHIVIDVFTHSAAFYPVPVLYPFTDRGFDGLAWNTPWFMAANYAALALAWIAALRRPRR